MYCPILRSKQFELIALRELIANGRVNSKVFLPIIEPVRLNTAPLIKTIIELNESAIEPLIVLNPSVGDFDSNPADLHASLKAAKVKFVPSYIVKDAKSFDLGGLPYGEDTDFAIIAYGGVDRDLIALSAKAAFTVVEHSKTNPLMFGKLKNVIVYEDSFKKKQRNSDYEEKSPFSYLHATYQQATNVVGFGDYTISPKEFVEGGGPAYVVTIHVSYIDKDEFDEMYVRHYSSYADDTPTNPQGKFLDALAKLIKDFRSPDNVFEATLGMEEFEKIYGSNHYPGLGQVKKISIKHHIETICLYLTKEESGE